MSGSFVPTRCPKALLDYLKLVFARAQSNLGGAFDLQVWIFAVDALEQVIAFAEAHGFGKGAWDEVLDTDQIEAGLFYGDNVGGGEYADVGH